VREVYLVGTIPLVRSLDVFTEVADRFGDRIGRVPDGEIGDRQMWVQSQYPVLLAEPSLTAGDLPEGGLTRRTSYQIPVARRPDADNAPLSFRDLGYFRHANANYQLFRALKAAGRIPAHWRFQVNLPMPMDVMPMVDPAIRAVVEPAYEAAMLAELAAIQAAIPHRELSITWDIVQGILVWEDPENRYVNLWFKDRLAGVQDRLDRLCRAVEPDVELGLHICYGSQDHRHALDPQSLAASVGLANVTAERLDRSLSYLHVTVPRDRDDEAYFAPLADLSAKTGKPFLGLIHYTDGVEGAARRIKAASRFCKDFGVATECGFGRRPSHQNVRDLLQLHADISAL
jgi:hypothetical protein